MQGLKPAQMLSRRLCKVCESSSTTNTSQIKHKDCVKDGVLVLHFCLIAHQHAWHHTSSAQGTSLTEIWAAVSNRTSVQYSKDSRRTYSAASHGHANIITLTISAAQLGGGLLTPDSQLSSDKLLQLDIRVCPCHDVKSSLAGHTL